MGIGGSSYLFNTEEDQEIHMGREFTVIYLYNANEDHENGWGSAVVVCHEILPHTLWHNVSYSCPKQTSYLLPLMLFNIVSRHLYHK